MRRGAAGWTCPAQRPRPVVSRPRPQPAGSSRPLPAALNVGLPVRVHVVITLLQFVVVCLGRYRRRARGSARSARERRADADLALDVVTTVSARHPAYHAVDPYRVRSTLESYLLGLLESLLVVVLRAKVVEELVDSRQRLLSVRVPLRQERHELLVGDLLPVQRLPDVLRAHPHENLVKGAKVDQRVRRLPADKRLDLLYTLRDLGPWAGHARVVRERCRLTLRCPDQGAGLLRVDEV